MIANLPQENMTFPIRYVVFLALCQKKDFKEIHFVKKDLKHFFKEKKNHEGRGSNRIYNFFLQFPHIDDTDNFRY